MRDINLVESNCLTGDGVMQVVCGTGDVFGTDELYLRVSSNLPSNAVHQMLISQYQSGIGGFFLQQIANGGDLLLGIYNSSGVVSTLYLPGTDGSGVKKLELHYKAGTVNYTINGNEYSVATAALDIGATTADLVLAGLQRVTGSMWDIAVGSGSVAEHHWSLAEGGGSIVYDSIGARNGVLNGATLPDCWANTQDEYHYNIINGYDLYENVSGDKLRVPIGATVVEAGWTYQDTYPTGKWHNLAETKMKLPADATLESICSGLTANIFYSAPATPSAFHPEDLSGAFDLENLHKIFFMIDEKKAFQLLFYSTAKTEDEMQKILKCGTKKYTLPDGYIFWKDSNGLYLRDVNGVLLFLEA